MDQHTASRPETVGDECIALREILHDVFVLDVIYFDYQMLIRCEQVVIQGSA